MDAKRKYFYELHIDEYRIFETQDPANEDFDVVLEISGKKLYAHKFKLTTISTTFDAMLSERWATPNEPIVIKDFSYDDIKEFLTFIYSGGCNFTQENIFVMVDIAEFYNVAVFKKACEDFLKTILGIQNVYRVLEIANKYSMEYLKTFCNEYCLTTELKADNIYQLLEVAYQYSMEDLKKNVHDFISKNLILFIRAQEFQSLTVNVMKDIVESNQNTVRQEKLFEMLYKWAEKRVLEKQQNDENLNLNEAIKEELNDFLPFIKFQLMNFEFLLKFVVSKTFLFIGTQLSDILLTARYLVTITDGNGKMMKGVLNCPDIVRVYNLFPQVGFGDYQIN